tara:strand:- start:39602 stop:40000 length:399 start_codon:yes stop_codon:yes gene_type:complete
MDGIGPELPLNRTEQFGVYSQITSYKEEVKQNFKNLLLTSPGERMMNPDFGVGLRRYLFEPRVHAAPQIRQRIEQQVNKYLPYIRISSIEFDTGHYDPSVYEDSNVISIKIIYDVPSIGLQASLLLESEEIN